MKQQEVSDILFKEFTEILAKHPINAETAPFITSAFGARWNFLPETPLEPMKKILSKIPFSLYFEKENEIKEVCLRATEDLQRLLTKQDVNASAVEEQS